MSEPHYTSDVQSTQFLACGDCDMVQLKKDFAPESKISCPRCAKTLRLPKKNSIDRCLALAITALILFVPAISLPLLDLQVLGITHSANMLTGVITLFENGMWTLAIVVLLFSIVAPLTKLLLVLCITMFLRLRRASSTTAVCLRWYHHLDEWGMLEVYTLGIIVAYTKLVSLAHVIPELGLYCFIAVLLIVSVIHTVMDAERFWELIEAQKNV